MELWKNPSPPPFFPLPLPVGSSASLISVVLSEHLKVVILDHSSGEQSIASPEADEMTYWGICLDRESQQESLQNVSPADVFERSIVAARRVYSPTHGHKNSFYFARFRFKKESERKWTCVNIGNNNLPVFNYIPILPRDEGVRVEEIGGKRMMMTEVFMVYGLKCCLPTSEKASHFLMWSRFRSGFSLKPKKELWVRGSKVWIESTHQQAVVKTEDGEFLLFMFL